MAKILVTEASREIRELLAVHVRRAGHEPVFEDAADVAAALVEPADPGALELAAGLRRRGLPLVFVSIEPPSERTAALAPAGHVEKPFTVAQLSAALAAAVPA